MILRSYFVFGLATAVLSTGCAVASWKNADLHSLLAAKPAATVATTPVATPATAATNQPVAATVDPQSAKDATVVKQASQQPPVAAENPTLAESQEGKRSRFETAPLPLERIAAGPNTAAAKTAEQPTAPASAAPDPKEVIAKALRDEANQEFIQKHIEAAIQKSVTQRLAKPGLGSSQADLLAAVAHNLPAASNPSALIPQPPAASPPSDLKEPPAKEQKPKEEIGVVLARAEDNRSQQIKTLEQMLHQRRGDLSREARIRYEQELRLLYLFADRMDEASQKIEALPSSAAESYRHMLFALGQITPKEDDKKPAHRHARALKALRDASQELSSASRLELRNMAFCESVEQFGWYQEFKSRDFAAGQQLLLYVEVDNVTSERKGPQQFETELHGSYQIFDTAGKLIAERVLPLDKENCRNWRRDYFLTYRIYLPDSIPPGNYRLELEIEDAKGKTVNGGKKTGEGIIEFAVK